MTQDSLGPSNDIRYQADPSGCHRVAGVRAEPGVGGGLRCVVATLKASRSGEGEDLTSAPGPSLAEPRAAEIASCDPLGGKHKAEAAIPTRPSTAQCRCSGHLTLGRQLAGLRHERPREPARRDDRICVSDAPYRTRASPRLRSRARCRSARRSWSEAATMSRPTPLSNAAAPGHRGSRESTVSSDTRASTKKGRSRPATAASLARRHEEGTPRLPTVARRTQLSPPDACPRFGYLASRGDRLIVVLNRQDREL